MGITCSPEPDDVRFPEFGFHLRVLEPGQFNARYHRENDQEAFLVLSGECMLIVEGEERPLRSGDFFHSPPLTGHVFVGAGEGPCTIVMVGGRTQQWCEGEGFPGRRHRHPIRRKRYGTHRRPERRLRRHPQQPVGTTALATRRA